MTWISQKRLFDCPKWNEFGIDFDFTHGIRTPLQSIGHFETVKILDARPRMPIAVSAHLKRSISTIEGMQHRAYFRLPALFYILLLFAGAATGLSADAPPFDLAGPKVDVHVQREGKTLPIAQVPNLLPGDRLWIHPDLPVSQSARYVLIIAFLRGSTNPPPAEWFRRVETWLPAVRQEGVFVVVPAEAQQALLFLAPETSGDFSTLRKAVQGRPGAFVRASQDLQLASWDRLRLDAYLAEVKALSTADAKILKDRTELAARSLGIRVDQQCFDKPTEQQAPCLIQHTDGLVLDDSNAQSVVTQMANGSAADMMNQLSYSASFGAGQFSPYVGAVVDMARILSTLHTAKYQYIPALALPQKEQQDTLNLRLNVPPSFRDPKSVIVVALPPVGPSKLPQLHPAELAQKEPSPKEQAQNSTAAANPAINAPLSYCATKPDLALSAEGSPLVFATAMAHDLTLHIETKAKLPAASGTHPEITPTQTPAAASPVAVLAGVDVPVRPDSTQGGFILEKPLPDLPENEVVAELRGKWGFDSWAGPKFHLIAPHSGGWTVPATDQNALITGREDTLHLQGASTLCVEDVRAAFAQEQDRHADLKLAWKSPKPELLDIAVPLKDAEPGTVTIAVHQYGLPKPEELHLKAYAEAAAIEHLSLSAGDKVAVLKGKRLDEVDSADMAGITFVPSALNRVQDFDQLEMAATGLTSTLQPGNNYSAKVVLRDGRSLHVPASVSVARPQIELLSKGVQHDESGDSATASVRLGSVANPANADDLPLQRRLVFFLRSRVPAAFPRTEKVELAAVDGSFETTLTLADGSLMLEDAHTAVATIDPLARFGASAFGPIQLRAVSANGVTGDWVPLGTLVRLPGFSPANALRCPRNPAKPCLLTGTNLFLITAVGATPDMANAVDVPAEFSGTALTVPNVARTGASVATASGANSPSATLYLRLRDDPQTVQTLSLPITAAVAGTTASVPDTPIGSAPAQPEAAKPESPAPEAATEPASNPGTASTKGSGPVPHF